jgi:hypothetical protein
VDAVLRGVDRDRDREEQEQHDLDHGTGRRDPLPDPERCDGQADGQPDEREREGEPPRPFDGDDHLVDDRDAGDRERAADPDRRLDPVDDRDQRPGQAPEGHPRPDVWASLVRKRRAELRDHETGGHEEQRADKGEPHDRLRAATGDGAERVEHDDRRDQETDGVEPAELAPEL